jgi:carbonic anhydrase
MLAAIGLILILTQIPHALGYDVKAMADEAVDMEDKGTTFPLIEGIKTIWQATQNYELGAIIISAISLVILIVWDMAFLKKYQFFKLVPGALIAVAVGTILNQVFIATAPNLALGGNHLVVLPVADSASDFISFFTLPDFTALTNFKVYITAATIALVASIESLLSVEAADKLDTYKRNTPTNQELKAQGIGNMVSGMIGGLPITAVIVRSSANINSGARTKMSAILHGILLLVCAIFIPNVLNLIPLSCLAALLLTVGYKLAKISLFKEMYLQGWRQLAPFLTTIIVILMTNLLVGIGVGMVLAIFFILKDNYKTPYFFKHDDRAAGEVYLLELSEHVSFLNKGSIQLTLDNLPKGSEIVIDGTKTVQIDYDVQELIYNFWNNAKQREITVELKNVDFKGFKPSKGH